MTIPSTTDGLLLVDKPTGMTSHDVVTRIRRQLRARRVGHAGTLDPFASGLLVLLVGRATRIAPYLDGEPKEYEVCIRFGMETTTDDPTGQEIRRAPLPTTGGVKAAVHRLTGSLMQVPPAFSAKKVEGVRSYAAARKGLLLPLEPVSIRVHSWTVHELTSDHLRATILCSGGTYVRALGRDLGRLADSAAHVAELRRVRSGAHRVTDAHALGDIGPGPQGLLPMLQAVGHIPKVLLAPDDAARVVRGIAISARGDATRVALVAGDGELLAIAERSDGVFRPRLVLRDAPSK